MGARTAAVGLAVTLALGSAQPVSADQLGIGFVTCITPTAFSCNESNGPVFWRIFNGLHSFANPEGFSEDLLDVTLEFQFEGGSRTWHWDRVPAFKVLGDPFAETDPFDASLVRSLTLLRFSGTLPRTVFDPVSFGNPRESFIASTPLMTASTTRFPPPLDFFAEGTREVAPVPEPGTMTLLGIGLAGIARRLWRQSV